MHAPFALTPGSVARTAIDRRVREGGRTSEAWRDYFRILLTRVVFVKEQAGKRFGDELDYLGIVNSPPFQMRKSP